MPARSIGVILLICLLVLLGISWVFAINIGNPEMDRIIKGLFCLGAAVFLAMGK